MKKLVCLVMVFVASAGLAQESGLVAKSLYEQIKAAESAEQAAELCRAAILSTDDVRVVDTAVSGWKRNDPDGFSAFAAEHATDPSAKFIYLQAHLARTDTDRVMLGRKAISADPDSAYGYYTLYYTYTHTLFRGPPDRDGRGAMEELFQVDEKYFANPPEKLLQDPYLLQPLAEYWQFKKDAGNVMAILKRAESVEAFWLSDMEFARAYLLANELEKTRERLLKYVTSRDGLIQDGRTAEQQAGYLLAGLLSQSGKREEALAQYRAIDGYESDPSAMYNIACLYALKGEMDPAVKHLFASIETGWDDLDHTRRDPDLVAVRKDPRWPEIEKAINAQWEKGAADRKAAALARKVDREAPGWQLKNAAGKTVSLSDYTGRILILDFWATWCGPCMRAMPLIHTWITDHPDDRVKVLSVNVWERNQKAAEKLFKDRNFAMELVFGDEKIPEQYGVTGIPHLCVIDGSGRIRFEDVGFSPDLPEKLSVWVEALK